MHSTSAYRTHTPYTNKDSHDIFLTIPQFLITKLISKVASLKLGTYVCILASFAFLIDRNCFEHTWWMDGCGLNCWSLVFKAREYSPTLEREVLHLQLTYCFTVVDSNNKSVDSFSMQNSNSVQVLMSQIINWS